MLTYARRELQRITKRTKKSLKNKDFLSLMGRVRPAARPESDCLKSRTHYAKK